MMVAARSPLVGGRAISGERPQMQTTWETERTTNQELCHVILSGLNLRINVPDESSFTPSAALPYPGGARNRIQH